MKTIRKKASGFYADSLEMLLDTMCNVLGGILFITLTLAVLTRHTSTPEARQQQTAQLTQELEAVNSSNSVVESQIEKAQLQLQNTQPATETNQMRLPSMTQTRKKPWYLIIRYGHVYSLNLPPTEARAKAVPNMQELYWHGSYVEPRAGTGEDPENSIKTLARCFQQSSQTNYFLAFLVYEDSFAAFNRAKELAFDLGLQSGWEPFTENTRLTVNNGRGISILPQE